MRCIVGLGSNLGDRLAHLRGAVRRLNAIGHVARLSRVYETAPVGGPEGQGPYLNADVLLGVEAEHGRVRRERNGPRTLDLDILWIDGIVTESDRLTVPHPRLTERPFALRPLLDVDPDAIDPWSTLPYTRLVDAETAHMIPSPLTLADPS